MISELDRDWDSLGTSDTRTAQQNLAAPEATNAMVAQVLAESVGERPTLEAGRDGLVRLPGGLYWEGELLRTAEVRELTGEDEEALSRVQGSLARWMSVLLERAVVRIGDISPTPAMIRKLLVGDRDELLVGVRIVTFGKDITARNIRCPHCDGMLDAIVDLSGIERVKVEEPRPRHEYEVPLRKGGTAVVRLPDGETQEALHKDDDLTLAERNTILLSKCLVKVLAGEVQDGRSGAELAKALSMADRQRITRYIAETQPGPRLDDITFEHNACGKEVRLPLTLPELFLGD